MSSLNRTQELLELEDDQQYAELLHEKALRAKEALSIYRPMPTQEPAHMSYARNLIIRGGNQSGKTASAAAEVAATALHKQIITWDGRKCPLKHSKKLPLVIWIIGFGWNHIGQTIHRVLFTKKSGLLMIRDEKTKLWRAWKPWDKADRDRRAETVPMEPFIPERYIKPGSFTWHDFGKKEFESVELINGTQIFAFSSNSEPKQGDQVDLIWIDEDVERPQYLSEWQARLSMRSGRIVWSALPHSNNEGLLNMSMRAEREKELGLERPDVFEIVLRFRDNEYMPADERKARLRDWEVSGEVEKRDLGHYDTESILMYPTFADKVHGMGPYVEVEPGAPDEALTRVLENRGYQPPPEWTRYMVYDPGHTQAAILFACVPPPEFGDFVVLYDELYPKGKDVEQTAHIIHKHIGGQFFHEFIIDWQAARVSGTGGGPRLIDRVLKKFQELNIRSDKTGYGFRKGSTNMSARVDAVRESLLIRGDGTARLKVCLTRCPNFVKEIKLYRKKKTPNGGIVDEPYRKHDHLMNCVEYLMARNPVFVYAPARAAQMSRAYLAFMQERGLDENPSTFHFGPGTPRKDL